MAKENKMTWKIIFAPIVTLMAILKVFFGLFLFVITGNMKIVEKEMGD